MTSRSVRQDQACDVPAGIRLQLQLQRPGFRLDIDQVLPDSGITVLFGASGSGKTTVLRCVAGLETRARGRVCIAADCWQDSDRSLFEPTWKRPIGYVFQEASLFEHLDVRGNLAFGMKRIRSSDAAETLDSAIRLLGIGHLLERSVKGLSGGERQRVAIARALATRPALLLLDEPMAALDHARRQELLPWFERLREQWRVPMLYVTHSPDEVARLADHLIVLEQGQVKAAGTPSRVMADIRVRATSADEVGALLEGLVVARDPQWHLSAVDVGPGRLWLADRGQPLGARVRVRVLARDVSVTLSEPQDTSILNRARCTIQAIAADAHPAQVLVALRWGERDLVARMTARSAQALSLTAGQQVWAQFKSVALAG